MASEMFQSSSKQTVEIILDPEVLGAMCRRGRRRLRDLNASSEADLRLDRVRGVLQVTGSPHAIEDIRRQLESVVGPCMAVTCAVWSELMRERSNPDTTKSVVAKIQEVSGCRVHIERTSKEIRLFGPNDAVPVAQQLLDQLDGLCIEETVDMNCPKYLDVEMLHAFAHEFGVALQVEEKQVIVLGISGAVKAAAQELRDYDSDQRQCGLGLHAGKPSEIACAAVFDAISNLGADVTMLALKPKVAMLKPKQTSKLSCNSTTADSLPPMANESSSSDTQMKAGRAQRHTKEDANKQCPFSPCAMCGDCGAFCVQCGMAATKKLDPALGACMSCGAANFCTYCGEPTQKTKLKNKAASQQSFPQTSAMPCGNQSVMMPSQYFPNQAAMPCGNQNVMMPGSPMIVPEGMMAVYVPSGMVPYQQPMMGSQANVMQACMVPMAFASAGYDVCC